VTSIKIAERTIGRGHPAYVIAEIGSNHDGSLERAKEIIALAAKAGADAVKFQSFTADGLVARKVVDVTGKFVDNHVHPIIDRLTLPAQWHAELKQCATNEGVHFLSAPFDLERLELLLELDVPAIKIASGDLAFEPLLSAAAKSGKPLLLSTGMAYQSEIDRSVAHIQGVQKERNLVLLHCVTSYPTSLEHANLRAIQTMEKRYGLPVGLSDHTTSLIAPVAAVAMGAVVIERHFTPDRTLSGPDHPFAIEPGELSEMVESIRELETMMGSGDKTPAPPELEEQKVGRRSLCAAVRIARGEVIGGGMLKCVRPGGGLDPFELPQLVGKRAARDIEQEEQLTLEDVAE
jgi:sialic acid synthase SpsE